MPWAVLFVLLSIAVISVILASNPHAGSIMSLVSNAWGVFGAAFGPAILLSLFWRRFTFNGAVAGIVAGAIVDIGWFIYMPSSGIYELLPGFVGGLIMGVVASLIDKEPSQEVLDLYDKAMNYEE